MGTVFAVTIFLSAWLLFPAQPIFSRMVIPLLGVTEAREELACGA